MSPRHAPAASWEKIAALGFGVVFITTLLVLAVFFPNPTPFQVLVFRVVLALAAAGVGAVVPGFIIVKVGASVRAGGALALFAVVYLVNPPVLVSDSAAFSESLRRGDAALAVGNHTAALAFYEDAIEANPASWKGHHGAGRTHFERGDYEQAAESLKRAVDLTDGKDWTLLYGLAIAEDGLGRTDDALVHLHAAEKLLPPRSPLADSVRFDLGLMSLVSWMRREAPLEAGRYDDAARWFRNVLERNISPAHWAHYHLACLLALRSTDDALGESERETLALAAAGELQVAVSALAAYRSTKASLQRSMMRTLLASPHEWQRRPGYPVACPVLVEVWARREGNLSTLLASVS